MEVAIINEPEELYRVGQTACVAFKLLSEGRSLKISQASFVRYLEHDGQDNGLLLAAETADATRLYFHVRLVIARALGVDTVKTKRAGVRALEVHQAGCALCAQSANKPPSSPMPSPRGGASHANTRETCEKHAYCGLVLKRKSDLVLYVRVNEETAAHSTETSPVQFRLQILSLSSLAPVAKLSSPFTVYDRVPRRLGMPLPCPRLIIVFFYTCLILYAHYTALEITDAQFWHWRYYY